MPVIIQHSRNLPLRKKRSQVALTSMRISIKWWYWDWDCLIPNLCLPGAYYCGCGGARHDGGDALWQTISVTLFSLASHYWGTNLVLFLLAWIVKDIHFSYPGRVTLSKRGGKDGVFQGLAGQWSHPSRSSTVSTQQVQHIDHNPAF